MISMTGYGYTEGLSSDYQYSCEVKSYNNRYLDVLVNIPSFLSPLEPKVRDFFSDSVLRGRVEVNIRYRDLEEDIELHLDKKTASAYVRGLKELGSSLDISGELQIRDFLGIEGIFKQVKNRDLDLYWERIQPGLEDILEQWKKSRLREGEKTSDHIAKEISRIKALYDIFIQKGSELEAYIKEDVRSRFQDVLGQEVDENRILSEVAVLLVKYSIKEEQIRLGSHLEHFDKLANEPGAKGKKLDFLCQEMGREINTIGSKSPFADLNQSVVEAKDALENIREQLKNVE
jgi:uncharacterized protein (TIGR00255 family)